MKNIHLTVLKEGKLSMKEKLKIKSNQFCLPFLVILFILFFLIDIFLIIEVKAYDQIKCFDQGKLTQAIYQILPVDLDIKQLTFLQMRNENQQEILIRGEVKDNNKAVNNVFLYSHNSSEDLWELVFQDENNSEDNLSFQIYVNRLFTGQQDTLIIAHQQENGLISAYRVLGYHDNQYQILLERDSFFSGQLFIHEDKIAEINKNQFMEYKWQAGMLMAVEESIQHSPYPLTVKEEFAILDTFCKTEGNILKSLLDVIENENTGLAEIEKIELLNMSNNNIPEVLLKGLTEDFKDKLLLFQFDINSGSWQKLLEKETFISEQLWFYRNNMLFEDRENLIIETVAGSGGFLTLEIYSFVDDQLVIFLEAGPFFQGQLMVNRENILLTSGAVFILYEGYNKRIRASLLAIEPYYPFSFQDKKLSYIITEEGNVEIDRKEVVLEVGQKLLLIKENNLGSQRILHQGDSLSYDLDQRIWLGEKTGKTEITIIPDGYDWNKAVTIIVDVVATSTIL